MGIANEFEATKRWTLNRFLTYRIARLNAALNAQATQLLAQGHGLSLGQWRVVVTIGKGGAGSSKQLLEMTDMDPALISRLLRQLENKGFMHTARSKADRRVLDVALTRKGEDVLNDTFPVMQARQSALADALQPGELAMLGSILERLNSAAQNGRP